MFALKPSCSVKTVNLPSSKTHKFSADTLRGLSADNAETAVLTSFATGHNYSVTLTVKVVRPPQYWVVVRGVNACTLSVDFNLLTADEGKGCVILPRPRSKNQEDTEIGTDSSSFLLSAPPSTPSLSHLLILCPHPVPFPSPAARHRFLACF